MSSDKAIVWVNDATVVGKVKIRRGPGYFSTKIDLNEGIEIVDFHGSFATKQAAASVQLVLAGLCRTRISSLSVVGKYDQALSY